MQLEEDRQPSRFQMALERAHPALDELHELIRCPLDAARDVDPSAFV